MLFHISKWKLPDVVIGEKVKLRLRRDTNTEFECIVAEITEDEVIVFTKEAVVTLDEMQKVLKTSNLKTSMFFDSVSFERIWEKGDGTILIEKMNEPPTVTKADIRREFSERIKEMFSFCSKNAMGIIDVDIAKGLVDKVLAEMEQE